MSNKRTKRIFGHDVPIINNEEDSRQFIKDFSDRNNAEKANIHAGFLDVMWTADRSAVALVNEERNFTFVMSNDDADGFADLIKQAVSENRRNL